MDFLRKVFPVDACDAMKLYSSVTINMNNEIAFSCWLRNVIKIFTSIFPGGLTIAIRIDHVDRIANEDDAPAHDIDDDDEIAGDDDNEPGEQLYDDDLLATLETEINGTDSNDSESSNEEYELESDSDEDGDNEDDQDHIGRRLRPGQVIHRETKLEILCNIGRHHDI